ncbi:hypothetical protein PAXRUDRAFT_783296 [Paxillus rubicundulus Ve08.2h10]|uniref:Zn(2)-C6 fungal-type domain-containing protein n=1 Tax=Paxillus rubicundulus Ve08.2h10 TaxID=930991 RepID=A0A0D0DWS8_9AGAM|nr:hypothetical protein PAXRUDRAFT_783296 [Paxillus rubicundulus Ve08.2h10]
MARPEITEQRERKKPGRVATSCAECRRLKLRCDRKVPCETCLKRGCGAICPNGSLTSSKGNRLVLANTEELHNRIEVMSARVRDLEHALTQARSQGFDELHPLLAGSITDISQGNVPESSPSLGQSGASYAAATKTETETVIDAFGTLTIGTRGETTFMSSTARSEVRLPPPIKQGRISSSLIDNPRLSRRVLDAWMPDNDLTPVDDELRKLVMGHLPPWSEAIRLCDIYLDWGKTLWNPLSRHELFDGVLGSVYRAESYESIPGPHDLSLLFGVFSLASLFDFDRPAYSVEAYEYYILSHVALNFSSACTDTTLHTVHAVLHIVQYLDLSDLKMDPSRAYVFIGLAAKLGYRVNLHGARFKLKKSDIQKRSTVFWQMFLMDTWLSFYAGRPPNVSPDWIDAPYPDDEFVVRGDKGESEMSWHSWSWRYSRLLHDVLVNAFGTKIPTYKTIVELDRKIRDFPIPPHLRPRCEKEGPQSSISSQVQRLYLLTSKEVTLLNLHRRYFSQALQEAPSDLLKHKYGPSVMAMYRSAWRLIIGHSQAVSNIPDVIARVPIFWSHAFSAAIVMCMIATRAPTSNMAVSSLHELDVVYDVFQKAAPTTKIATVLLDHITKIWRKGHEAVDHPNADGALISRAELDRLGGGSTRLISNNSPLPSHAGSSASSSSEAASDPYAGQNGIPVSSPRPSSVFELSSSIHPRIMQDMRSFNGFEPSFTAAATHTESLVQAMTDAQFSQNVFDAELYAAAAQQQVLNTFPQPFAAQEMYRPDGLVLDSAWQRFVEQLGF